MKNSEKLIEKAQKEREKLSAEYGVSVSEIVWIGDSHFIIVKGGEEIRI